MSIGDINSTKPGTAARYNSGKAQVQLLPLGVLAERFALNEHYERRGLEISLLTCLGGFQSEDEDKYLYLALDYIDAILLRDFPNIGIEPGTRAAADVFDYGRKKYAEWNWAKGMPWSECLASAARHVLKMLNGETIDSESGLVTAGHVACNIYMLLTYTQTYPEGNDLPRGRV